MVVYVGIVVFGIVVVAIDILVVDFEYLFGIFRFKDNIIFNRIPTVTLRTQLLFLFLCLPSLL